MAACPDEANKFFAFLADAAASQLRRGTDLQIMFGIGGERDLSERELPHLAGWRDHRPVRVGNGAWSQRQLDVYGEMLGAAERLVQLGGSTRSPSSSSPPPQIPPPALDGQGPGYLGDPRRADVTSCTPS